MQTMATRRLRMVTRNVNIAYAVIFIFLFLFLFPVMPEQVAYFGFTKGLAAPFQGGSSRRNSPEIPLGFY